MNHQPDRDLLNPALPKPVKRVNWFLKAGAPFTTCQWLEGEPKERNFCGDPSVPGKSYCARHAARCFLKNKESED